MSSKNKVAVTDVRNEAARRLGIPVCEVCSEPACERRREQGLNALLCDRCYIDWLKRELRRELREEEAKPRVSVLMISEREEK